MWYVFFLRRCPQNVEIINIAHTQSVRNTLDEEERIDERKNSSGNFVEEIVADIDSLFDFSKAGENTTYEDNETTTIELENLSHLRIKSHRKSSAASTDSPRGDHLKRRRSSHDDNDATVSLQIRSDDDTSVINTSN